jgi:hypothetical protein
VIYTAIFGDRDHLREPLERLPGVQYICFTDNPRLCSDTWSIRYHPPSDDPLLQAKRLKILAHEAVDCDVSLWLDGRITLRESSSLFEFMESDLSLQAHPARHCIYEEAEHCKVRGKGNPAKIDEAVRRYANDGHPQNAGLWYGGLILRRHTPAVRRFNEMWWREITSGTTRDQISFPVVLRRSEVSFETMSLDRACVSLHQHAR